MTTIESKIAQIDGRIITMENIVAGRPERKSIGQRLLTSDNLKKFEAKTADLLTVQLSPR